MKQSFLIQGLGGEKTLTGTIAVNGAKNDVLKAIASAFLFKDTLFISRVPNIKDVSSLLELVRSLGAEVTPTKDGVSLSTPEVSPAQFDRELAKKLRSSVVLTGPILARYGRVMFPHPGGCVIGARPIDLFIRSFEKMGATCTHDQDFYYIDTHGKKLRGADIFLDIASVGVTETVMMAAVLAEGVTYIRNAAMEPEIQNLAHFLVASGARIDGIGTPTMRIEGGGLLHAENKVYQVIPDRIETGSFVILSALAGKDVTITECNPAHVMSLLSFLTQAGVRFDVGDNFIRVQSAPQPYRAVNLRTHTYPGFATDLQAPMTIFLTQAEGESLVFETIFEGRLNYTEDIKRMGANITMFDPHRVMVKGQTPLSGKELEGPDLRAGLAYVIAGVVASGNSIIRNISHIDRGHENLEERLKTLGVSIARFED